MPGASDLNMTYSVGFVNKGSRGATALCGQLVTRGQHLVERRSERLLSLRSTAVPTAGAIVGAACVRRPVGL